MNAQTSNNNGIATRVVLPKHLDKMSERENRKYKKALDDLAFAVYQDDKRRVDELAQKFNFKFDKPCEN